MAMRYSITHKTVYQYNAAVSVSHHLIRLKPRELSYQRPLHYELTADPAPALVDAYQDYFGNPVSFVTIEGPHRQLVVASRCEVEVTAKPSPALSATPPWESVRELCRGDVYNAAGEACEFSFPSPLIPLRPEFAQYAEPAFSAGRPLLEAAVDLMQRIHNDFKFDPEATTVATPLEQVFRQRRGVCQDFAQLQIACFRALGLPARYVSGYLETVPPPGQTKLLGADASHAWIQLWCGKTGWIDLDPTNNLLPGERHITLGWGRDFADVSPLRGVLVGSGSHQLKVAVDVIPLDEQTRAAN
jgi:transglutaminase-like putative cysteine protease